MLAFISDLAKVDCAGLLVKRALAMFGCFHRELLTLCFVLIWHLALFDFESVLVWFFVVVAEVLGFFLLILILEMLDSVTFTNEVSASIAHILQHRTLQLQAEIAEFLAGDLFLADEALNALSLEGGREQSGLRK